MKKNLQKWVMAPIMASMLLAARSANAIFEYQGRPITLAEINDLIESFINFLYGIGGLIVVGFLVWNGIKWASAGDDAKQVDSAKAGVKAAILGALVLFGIGVILATVRVIVSRGFFNY